MTAINHQRPDSDRLALLYRLSQTFNSSLDLDEVLNRVMDEVIAATRAERGFVMLREPEGQHPEPEGERPESAEGERPESAEGQRPEPVEGRMTFCAARGLDQTTIDEPQFQVSRSVVERVARQGDPILTSDAQTDDRFSMRQSVLSLGLRSILCVPLAIKDDVTGVVYVDNRLQSGIFTQEDLDLLNAIASSAAIAIENARLYQVAVEKGRLERELQMARQVQASLLPRQTPRIPDWEFVARWRPAREVAGDYYDFIPLDEGRLGLVIADVTDKGMPAALFMALTRSIVRASVHSASSPAEGLARANRLVCADSFQGMFVTLFYAQLDLRDGEMTYVNAGHNPPLLCQAAQGGLTRLACTGLPLGIEADISYEQHTVQLVSGDCVLFYTDGVTDAINTQGQDFGMRRLEQVVQNHHRASATEALAALESELDAFTGPTAPFDDIAILVLKCLM